jgi:sensor histidine kinase YesM
MQLEFSTKNKKFNRIIQHIAFWILIYLMITILFSASGPSAYWQIFILTAGLLPFEIAGTYFTIYYFIPVFLLRRRYAGFIGLSILLAVISVAAARFLNYHTYTFIYPQYSDIEFNFFSTSLIYIFIEMYFVVCFATGIKLVKYWFKNQKVKTELENQNLASELALLRSQINPHFLFNTLNNIDSLIFQNQQKASDSIIKLSGIMRYMLYESTVDMVLLTNEIEYIRNYIALFELRIKNKNFIQFSIVGNSQGRMIAPMLFVPFVENAFKHGSKKVKSPGIIINMIIENKIIEFEVTNFFNDVQNTDKTGGIGLNNIRRRLELIYPEKHELLISSEKNFYKVNLKINTR